MSFVCSTDADKAREFYEGKLGLPFVTNDGFAAVFDNHGIDLRVAITTTLTPAQYTVLGWEVDDIEQAVEKLKTAGVEMKRYSFLPQNEAGIWTAPDGARVAWFNDPDGNVLSVSQHSA